ncbi:MAG: hypothetical protein OZ933_08265 [Chloroflexota bacterium]|nr:hypothetical protein [Chloroflexota bacterium]
MSNSVAFRMTFGHLFVLVMITTALSLSMTSGAFAQNAPRLSFNVNSSGDGRDLSLDGVCDADPGPGIACTLRAALQEADWAGAATITIPAMTILTGPETIDQFVTGDFDVFGGNIVLQGAGQGSTIISGNNLNRVFELSSGAIIMRDLTVTAGASTADGGGIYARNNVYLRLERVTVTGNSAVGWGGGITQGPNSTVEVFDSRIVSNQASQIGGIGPVFGDPGTTLTIVNSEIAQNSALSGNVGGVYSGVGVFSITNSTISGNTAPVGGSGGIEIGAGAGGSAIVTHTTITANTADGYGGGLTATSTLSPQVRNSIIAGNSATYGSDCFTFSANIEVWGVVDFGSINYCGITNNGAYFSADPQLGPLEFNGAATRHHLPQIGSPVVNAATGSGVTYCTPADQIGQARPRGAFCDIGAIERAAGIDAAIVASSATVVPGGPNPLNQLTITVTDPDQPAGPSVDVNVVSASGSPESETITLPSLGGGVYSATVSVNAAPITAANGIIEAAPGDVLRFVYTDIFGDSAGPEDFTVDITAIPLGVAGQISVNRLTVVPKSDAPYFEQNNIEVTYIDPDFAGAGSITVTITDLQDGVSVTGTLNEQSSGTFVRTFSFRTDVTLGISGAVIRAVPGHIVEFSVLDDPDGMAGSTNRIATVTVIDEGVTGILSSAPAAIQPGDPVTLSYVDPDTSDASYAVTLTTPAGDSETFTVPSTGSGQYSMQVSTAAGSPVQGDGVVQVSLRDILTFQAVDFKDSSGGVSVLSAETAVEVNVLVNGGFEDEFGNCLLAPWITTSDRDKVKGKNAHTGSCAFRFKGESSRSLEPARLQQPIADPVSGYQTGDVLTVKAWVDTSAMTDSNVKIFVKYSDGSKQSFKAVYIITDDGNGVYDPISTYTILDLAGGRTVSKLQVRINDKSTAGKWFIDSVELWLSHPSEAPAPRVEPAPDGVLPPPAAPTGFRGGN